MIKTLSNGLRVVVKPLPGTKAVTCLVMVGAGSRYETKPENGIAHFLEHMFFKGAKKFTSTRKVSEAIDGVGGDFNAFTGKEYAGYYVKVAGEYVHTACDVLSDMLIHAKLDQAEIDKERGVILEEYNMYQDTPMYQVGWNFEGLLFGDQPMGRDQIGTRELITTVSHDDFVAYKEALYVPENTVIAMVGNITEAEGEALIEKYFADYTGKKNRFYDDLATIETGRVSVVHKTTEQAHLVIGFPGISALDENYYGAKILSILLGGNMSSRMFLNVREAHGLAYYISTSSDDYSDTGVFSTRAGVDTSRAHDAVKAIVAEYKKVYEGDIPEDEVKKSIAYLVGKIQLRLEDSEEFAHFLSKRLLIHGAMKTPEEIIKSLKAVTVEDVKKAAKAVLKPENLKMAIIGPYEDSQSFEDCLGY